MKKVKSESVNISVGFENHIDKVEERLKTRKIISELHKYIGCNYDKIIVDIENNLYVDQRKRLREKRNNSWPIVLNERKEREDIKKCMKKINLLISIQGKQIKIMYTVELDGIKYYNHQIDPFNIRESQFEKIINVILEQEIGNSLRDHISI